MLAVARDKSLNLGVSKRPRFQNADVKPSDARCFFDGIVSGFCFGNIENRLKALEEMYRVLKKNGKLLILEAIYPENSLVRFGYKLYTPFVPLIGKLLGFKQSYSYLLDSIEDFPKKEKVVSMFNMVGFRDIQG